MAATSSSRAAGARSKARTSNRRRRKVSQELRFVPPPREGVIVVSVWVVPLVGGPEYSIGGQGAGGAAQRGGSRQDERLELAGRERPAVAGGGSLGQGQPALNQPLVVVGWCHRRWSAQRGRAPALRPLRHTGMGEVPLDAPS